MALLVDTSVWSLAFRRDAPEGIAEVRALRRALAGEDLVVTTGMVVLELLRGFLPSRVEAELIDRFSEMSLVEPTREDYFEAARVHNACRRAGVQLGSVDALIAQLAIAHDLTLLTTDRDFEHAAHHVPLRLWKPS